MKGFLLSWLGRWAQASEELQRVRSFLESQDLQGTQKQELLAVYWAIAATKIERGNFEDSRKDIRTWFDFLDKNWPGNKFPENYFNLHTHFDYQLWTGYQELKEGRLDAARARLEELQSLISRAPNLKDDDRQWTGYWTGLLASEIQLAEGSREKAVETFKQVPRFGWYDIWDAAAGVAYNSPFIKDVAARAFAQKGDIRKAIAEYERLTSFDAKNPERRLIHPLYHYRWLSSTSRRGKRQRPRARYERFLELWKDADPGQAEVDDARVRLAAL